MAEEAKTVAVKSTQDLISFSLGAPRDGADVEVDAPESMEIKSTKQVAKAVPVETPSDEAEPLIPPSDAMGSMDADEAAARVDEACTSERSTFRDSTMPKYVPMWRLRM